MLASTTTLLSIAEQGGFAIGAFNVYNLEGARAVVAAAEAEASPAMLEVQPGSMESGGEPLVALCLTAARLASVPMSVHLDHCRSRDGIEMSLEAGLRSVMADGSHLDYEANVGFTRDVVQTVHYDDGVAVPLVLHGASGLPEDTVRSCIELGVRKLNVNTEVRQAYVDALAEGFGGPEQPDLVELMDRAISAMQDVVSVKLRLFASSDKH